MFRCMNAVAKEEYNHSVGIKSETTHTPNPYLIFLTYTVCDYVTAAVGSGGTFEPWLVDTGSSRHSTASRAFTLKCVVAFRFT